MSFITIYTAQSNYAICSESILRCQINPNYSVIYLSNNDSLRTSKPTPHLKSELLTQGFIAISYNQMVNTIHVEKILLTDYPTLILKDSSRHSIEPELIDSIFHFLENI